jgi:hypothetical protein
MTAQMDRTEIGFRHLVRMTDDRGILEHAKYSTPRYSHGYCTDDNARLAIVAARDGGRTYAAPALARIGLGFTFDAQSAAGATRNRMSFERIWLDEPTLEDCWGRSLWAFGTVRARSGDESARSRADEAFARGAVHRSPYLRSMVFAALGAAEILAVEPENTDARELLADAADMIGPPRPDRDWPWPEDRLSYSNAALPEVLLHAGHLLGDDQIFDDGLRLLQWLVDTETHGGHFSVTPSGGRGPGDPKPAFDQQPLELWALADACATAFSLTEDHSWRDMIDRAVAWFVGDNDSRLCLIDAETHGCFDGLEDGSVNHNQGAESTLSMLATLQHDRR